MRAAIVTPGKAHSMRVADVPAPVRKPDECLVRVLEVRVCGTDRDIDAGHYGEAPAGADYLIDGHESLGEVIEGPTLEGELVVAMVRRPWPEVVVYSRGPRRVADHVIREIIGERYVSADDQKLTEGKLFDIAMDATGYSPLAWAAAEVLDVNGVLCMLSVTGGKKHIDIPSDELNDTFVLGNRLLFGSVNASREDFENGVRDFGELERRWPGRVEDFITSRLPLDQLRTDRKSVVEGER